MGGYDEDGNMDDSKRAERKFKKHMVEKRRRNRINYALDQLKMMVLEGLDKDPTKYDKMEKADILDLTVKYLHRILKENIHFGPEMIQSLPPMFGEHFAGTFLHHPHLPPPHGILPEPCTSNSLLEEPLDLHNKTVTSQSTMTSQSALSVTSDKRQLSPCIDIDSDDSDSDYDDDDDDDDVDKHDDHHKNDDYHKKGFKPVKKSSDSSTVKRSVPVDAENPPKRPRFEKKTHSDSSSHPMPFSSIKLNITGQTVPALGVQTGLMKPGPGIIRPVATVPRLSLRTDTNIKTYPGFPYPPFPTLGAPLVPLPLMPSDPSWRPW